MDLARVGEAIGLHYLSSDSRAFEVSYAAALGHSEVLLAVAAAISADGVVAGDGTAGMDASENLSATVALRSVRLT